jgi:phenylacetate-CoA ligase
MMTGTRARHRRAASSYPDLLALGTRWVTEPLLGTPYLSIQRWLDEFDSWPAARRDEWQRQRLARVLRYAAQHVPYYRSLLGGVSPDSVRLEELPVVGKADLRGDPQRFRSEGWQAMPTVYKDTSGTSGDPWQYPLDRTAWSHVYGALLHFWAQLGCRYGERVVLLGTPPSLGFAKPSRLKRARHRVERHIVSVAGLEIDRESSRRRALGASRADAAVWFGYPSIVAAMADAVLAEGLQIAPPRAIVTTSETLQSQWERAIEGAFGIPPTDLYGCNDGGILAQRCPRGRYHLAENLSLVEVLEDGRRCPPGTEGDVVVTNLHARAMPFLRYRVGDRAVMGEDTCPCGRPGRTLKTLLGRVDDVLELPNGRRLSPMTFSWAFADTTSVRRWQVVQDGSAVTVRLEVDERLAPDDERKIRTAVKGYCGRDVHVKITTDEPLLRSQGGKHRAVVRIGALQSSGTDVSPDEPQWGSPASEPAAPRTTPSGPDERSEQWRTSGRKA